MVCSSMHLPVGERRGYFVKRIQNSQQNPGLYTLSIYTMDGGGEDHMWGLHTLTLDRAFFPGYRIDSGDQQSTMMMTGRRPNQ